MHMENKACPWHVDVLSSIPDTKERIREEWGNRVPIVRRAPETAVLPSPVVTWISYSASSQQSSVRSPVKFCLLSRRFSLSLSLCHGTAKKSFWFTNHPFSFLDSTGALHAFTRETIAFLFLPFSFEFELSTGIRTAWTGHGVSSHSPREFERPRSPTSITKPSRIHAFE